MSKNIVVGVPITIDANAIVDALIARIQALTQADDRSTSHTQPPALGQPWPEQGGIYAGIVRGDSLAGDYHLIVAPVDTELRDVKWGERGIEIDGAKSLRDGLANTRDMVRAGNALAQAAVSAVISELADWYLPARHELRLTYLNAPESFATDVLYWSSTQTSAYYAWYQGFDGGGQDYDDKDYEGRVRFVRRLSVIQ
ncbi:MAG: hypothetical protein QM639_04450 [Rhodocyclaceae bacterium]